MSEFTQELARALTALDWEYSEEQLKKCQSYWDLLLETNEKINLTAITHSKEGAVKHFADSLCLLKYGKIKENASLIDIGTGAGFPGLVLAIFRTDLEITLLDSLEKRCNFLNTVIDHLSLTGVNVVWSRAEEAGQSPLYREVFDYATARAVAALPVLLEYALPLLKVGGSFFAMKGPGQDDDPGYALQELKGEFADEVSYALPLTQEERRLYQFIKISPTPDKYPRRPGKPGKSPLRDHHSGSLC